MNRDTATAKANYCGPGIYAQRPDHNTGNYVPFSLRAVSGWGKGGGGGGARGKYVVKSGGRRSATIFFFFTENLFRVFPSVRNSKKPFGFSEKEKKTIITKKNKQRAKNRTSNDTLTRTRKYFPRGSFHVGVGYSLKFNYGLFVHKFVLYRPHPPAKKNRSV